MAEQITIHIDRLITTLTGIVCAAVLPSCASVEPQQNGTGPMTVSEAHMTVSEAHSLVLTSSMGLGICKSDNTFSCGNYETPKVKLALSSLVIDDQYTYELATLKLKVSVHSWPSDSVFLVFNDGMAIMEDQNQDARAANRLLDALLTLKEVAILNDQEIGSVSDATFAKAAADYRNASTKPTISEDSRKYQVQAEGAIRDKQYEEAAYRYCEALKSAPWWAEAHFNRALVLGEMKEYRIAVKEMQRYLSLIPDAPDAQAAQNKIYDWERKVGH